MIKSELRHKYKALRASLTEEKADELSLNIANTLLKMTIWDKNYYHVFLPIQAQNEVNTDHVLNILQGKDKHCVISKSDFSTYKMTHYLLQDNTTLKLNNYGIPEPIDGIEISIEKLEVVFIPLLAYDTKGHRVGYGKGFYDRFLAGCNPDCIKIGLSFFKPEPQFSELESTDIKLDYCVTPDKFFKF